MPSISIDPTLRTVDGDTVFAPGRTAPRWQWLQWIITYGFWVLVAIDVASSIVEGHWGTRALVEDVAFLIVIVAWLFARRERRKHPRPTEPFVVPGDLLAEARTLYAAGERSAAVSLVRERTNLGLTDSLALARLADAAHR